MDFIRKRITLFITFLSLIFLTTLATFSLYQLSHARQLAIGAKDPEGHLLAEIMAQLYEAKTGKSVTLKPAFDGTFLAFNALLAGEIDLYMEYTGTAYTAILKRSHLQKSEEEVLSELKEVFLEHYNLVWMDRAGFKSAYVIITTSEIAEKYQLRTLSDLKEILDRFDLKVAFDPEFCSRPEFNLLTNNYQIKFNSLQRIEHTLLYLSLLNSGIDIMNGYAADSDIYAHNLCVLEDDLNYFPAYEAVPLVSRKALEEYPKLQEILSLLAGKITLDEMKKMNYAVEKKGESVYNVARTFLVRKGFL